MDSPELSFIIPALNEERALPQLLQSIQDFVPESLRYEILVADNGSEDETVDKAHEYGATVFVDDSLTVAGLRNLAAGNAKGKVYVFLDADICLTSQWGDNIMQAYEGLLSHPAQITGSRCGLPLEISWIERYWFQPLMDKTNKYINSGHLITTPELFWKIGGFDESMISGEDYAFGVAASNVGAEIINNPSLSVIHEGYPKTLLQFIKREIWHGVGESRSFRTIKTSSVAVASILFFILHLIMLYGFMYNKAVFYLSALIILSSCAYLAVTRHRTSNMRSLLIVAFLYYVYLLSRFVACIPVVNTRIFAR